VGPRLAEANTHFRGLHAAWSVVAACARLEQRRSVAEGGRALESEFQKLATEPSGLLRASSFEGLEQKLASFELALRQAVGGISVSQLRSTVPTQLRRDHRGVLALLDLLLGAELEAVEGSSAFIPSIDYLLTALCKSGGAAASGHPQDPVTLTPRMQSLCERATEDYDERLPSIEAEFFTAADAVAGGASQADALLRSLACQKAELGSRYFTPTVLRAIITYNIAIAERIEEEIWETQPARDTNEPADPMGHRSVFETQVLRGVAKALRRREVGGEPGPGAIDQLAWSLDLDALNAREREALMADSAGHAKDLEGTTVLVGLLRGSDPKLASAGIAAEELTGSWTRELDSAVTLEIKHRVANQEYASASALSALKTRFLDAPPGTGVSGQGAPRRRGATGVEIEPATRGRGARAWWGHWRRAGLAALTLLGALGAWTLDDGRTHTRAIGPQALSQISPHLAEGGGHGGAFTGTLSPDWTALDEAAQTEAGDALVANLRAQGWNQVMVFDGARRLRIQALGAAPPLLLGERGF